MGDLYAILTAISWASAVIFFDISSKKFEALQLSAIKNSIGVLGFLITILIFSIPIPKFTLNELSTLVFSGLLGILIADLLFLDSLRRIGSGNSALVSTIYTPSIFILAFFLFNETISGQSYFGGILVVTGIALTVYKIPKKIKRIDLYIGIIYGVLAQVFTAYAVLIVRPILDNHSILFIALYRFTAGLTASVIICCVKSGIYSVLINYKNGFTNYHVLFGSFLGTYLSVILWLAGFKYTLAGRAAIYNQLSTVFIVIMARVFLKEPLNYRKVIGLGLAILGAILVSIAK